MTTANPAPAPRKRKRLWLWLCWGGVIAILLCALVYPYAKRSIPGRLVRFAVTGVPIARQVPNDLADDVRDKRRLRSLQEWSTQTLTRYRSGQVATNGKAAYWSRGTVTLAPREVPGWLSGAWSGEPPEVSVRLNKSGTPECITVGWYLHGLLVGPPDYVTTMKAWCLVQAKPGIYAYHDYK